MMVIESAGCDSVRTAWAEAPGRGVDVNPESLADYGTKTYRYLRLGILGLTVTLAASVIIEIAHTSPTCVLPSISAYYYTPAQAVFVSALVAIGLCMIAIKAPEEWEDVLLNIAGMLAPVVAFVPTPQPGDCSSVILTPQDAVPKVVNNVWALFVTGVVALVVTVAIAIRYRTGAAADRVPTTGWKVQYTVGIVAAALIMVGGILWLQLGRSSFVNKAHYTAAIALFVCFIIVTALNAWAFGRTYASQIPSARKYANRYSVIATLMLVSGAVLGLATWLGHWNYGVLAIEAALIALFAAFWLMQTIELWDAGIRSNPAAAPAGPVDAAPIRGRSGTPSSSAGRP
jgi:hypothetical protein